MKKLILACIASATFQISPSLALELRKTKKPFAFKKEIQESLSPDQERVNTAFFEASLDGDVVKVLEQLHHGANPNTICPKTLEWYPHALKGATALMCAAHRANLEMCQLLLSEGANPAIRDPQNRNALLHAGFKKNREIFFLLLERTAVDNQSFDDLNYLDTYVRRFSHDDNNRNALDATNKQTFQKYIDDTARLCIRSQTIWSRKDQLGKHLLHYVASWGSREVCEQLIQGLRAREINTEFRSNNQETPLFEIPTGSEANCRLLLENGANPNASALMNDKEVSPLMRAVKLGNDGIADILIEFGASSYYLNLSLKDHSHLLKKMVYVPMKSSLASSIKTVQTALLCFKRVCPTLPKDVRYLILDMIHSSDLGHCMIARKLSGFPIPSQFMKAASKVLLRYTMAYLKKNYKVSDGSVIQNAIEENILKRLAKEKLTCNNPGYIKL